MKQILQLSFSLIFVVLVHNSADAQLRKLPAAVTEAFHEKYPAAVNVEWKDKLTSFVAAFDMDGIKYEARFSNKGEWKDTETGIDIEAIPEAVMDGYKKSKYAEEWEIEEAKQIELPGDKIQYRLMVEKNDIQKKYLTFNSRGRLLKDNITL